MMNATPQTEESLTALMRAAWATIYRGQDIIAQSEELECACDGEAMIDESIPGPRLRASWDLRKAGEDTERWGVAMAARVEMGAARAGLDIQGILAPLIAERSRPVATA